jgi:PhnB protein
VPEDFRQKVMHATFNGNGFTFMAADGRPGKSLDADAGNISLSLTTSDDSEGTRIFNALAADGEITMALEPQFWGGKFGQVVDKFATEWMISIR